MRRDDWICHECFSAMVKTMTGDHLVCINEYCKSKLRVAKQLMDLPVITKFFRWYILAGLFETAFDRKGQPLKGYWQLVPHMHKDALDRIPEPGHVVARVYVRGNWQTRTLRQVYPSRSPKLRDNLLPVIPPQPPTYESS